MNRAGVFHRISNGGFPWEWLSFVHAFCFPFLLYCMVPSGSGVKGTIPPQAVAEQRCPSALSFGGQSTCQEIGVTFKGACGFVLHQQHVRRLHVAKICLSKRGPEEGWDRTVFIGVVLQPGSVGMQGSAAALMQEDG